MSRQKAAWLCIAIVLCACRGDAARKRGWRTHEKCSLLKNAANDGDSFHVQSGRWEYIFRLYFVDTPETAADYPDRVEAQAAYWGIGSEDALKLGKNASIYTAEWLRDGFTVYTRLEDARGMSKQKRFFAMVRVGDKYLSEALVANGLARVYGWRTDLPDGTKAYRYLRRLKRAEARAREAGLGGWGRGKGG